MAKSEYQKLCEDLIRHPEKYRPKRTREEVFKDTIIGIFHFLLFVFGIIFTILFAFLIANVLNTM